MKQRLSPLAREIRQTRPFASSSQEAIVGLLRTTDLVRRALARVVEAEGITLQQYNVLRILRGAGHDGLATLEIANRMIEQAPGITRLMDRLEAKGLVKRERCSHDRRQVLCRITPSGLKLLGTLDRPVCVADEACLRLPPSDLRRLIRLLDAVRAGHTLFRSGKEEKEKTT